MFLAGQPLEECPKLLCQAARLRFVSVVERKVEGLHSQIHMHLKPRISLVHVNFHAMLPRLQTLLTKQPTALQDLAAHFYTAKQLF